MHATRKRMAKGFTLVEILIVVVILGILAAIVVPQFTNAANDSRRGNVSTQVSTIESQLELYAARNDGSYPDLATDGETFQDLVDTGYFKEIPANPFGGGTDIGAFPDDAETNEAVVYGDFDYAWAYDADTGNIAATAPTSADPDAADDDDDG